MQNENLSMSNPGSFCIGCANEQVRRLVESQVKTAPAPMLASHLNVPTSTRFIQVGSRIMFGSQCVGAMHSKTLAKRVAHLLNTSHANREGV